MISMRKMISGVVVVAATGMGSPAHADLVAYWNFNDFNPIDIEPETDTLSAHQGSAEIDFSDWSGDLPLPGATSGSEINARNGDEAGKALFLGPADEQDGSFPGNGSYITISFSMAGLQSLDVSYWSKGSWQGFNDNQWSYSADGQNFTDFGPVVNPDTSDGELITLPTLNSLDGATTAYLRYTLDGAERSGGINRVDNLQLNASVIPEPTTLALVAMGGALTLLRRRQTFA